MEEASRAAAHGGLAAALADNLDPSGEASPGKAVVDAGDADVLVASGEGVLPEHAVTAVVGDEEVALDSRGSEPETQAVAAPVTAGSETGTDKGPRTGASSDAVEGTTGVEVELGAAAANVNLSLAEVSGEGGLLATSAEEGVGDEAQVVDAVVTTLRRPPVDEGDEADAAVTGGWLGNGYCRPEVFGIEIDSLLGQAVVGLRALAVGLVVVAAVATHGAMAGESGSLLVDDGVTGCDDAAEGEGEDSGDGKSPATTPTLPEGDMGALAPRGESPSPDILSALVTGTNSFGSYLSLTFSNRLESSSNTEGLARI